MIKKFISILLVLLMLSSFSVTFVSAQESTASVGLADATQAKDKLGEVLENAVKLLTSPEIGSYTYECCEALQKAISEGYEVYYNPDSTVEDFTSQIGKVQGAIDNMKKIGVSEETRDYLSSVIADAESQVGIELDYTPESYMFYSAAMVAAVRALSEGESDAELLAAAEDLMDAVKGLVPVAANVSQAREYLRMVINDAYALLSNGKEYTSESVSYLESAIESANTVYYDTSATVQKLYIEADWVVNAMNSMVEVAIPEDIRRYLADIIDMVESQVEGEEYYTAESFAEYSIAYEEAKRVQSFGTSKDEFISAANALEKAFSSLVPATSEISTAKSYLLTLIQSANSILRGESNYTTESADNLKNALELANSILVNDDATLQEVLEETENLQAAIDAMVEVTVSEEVRGYLKSAIDTAQAVVKNEEDYTAESFGIYYTAYTEALRVYSEGDSEEEFINAANALGEAIVSLVLKADVDTARAELGEWLNCMPTEGNFTSESLTRLEETIEAGRSVYEDPNATIEEILERSAKIQEAYYLLEEKEVEENPLILGDADLNSKITVRDATLIQKYVADISELSDDALSVADTNGDGRVNVRDATEIQKYLAGLSANENIGKPVSV